jgi:hypothetical protein
VKPSLQVQVKPPRVLVQTASCAQLCTAESRHSFTSAGEGRPNRGRLLVLCHDMHSDEAQLPAAVM